MQRVSRTEHAEGTSSVRLRGLIVQKECTIVLSTLQRHDSHERRETLASCVHCKSPKWWRLLGAFVERLNAYNSTHGDAPILFILAEGRGLVQENEANHRRASFPESGPLPRVILTDP